MRIRASLAVTIWKLHQVKIRKLQGMNPGGRKNTIDTLLIKFKSLKRKYFHILCNIVYFLVDKKYGEDEGYGAILLDKKYGINTCLLN